jgi:hypothetical protein
VRFFLYRIPCYCDGNVCLLAGNYPSTSKEQQLRALKGKMSALPTDEEKVDLDLSIQVFATGE